MRLILSALVMIVCAASAQASWPARDAVRVCVASPGEAQPPPFDAPQCETTLYWTANPQNRTLWIEAIIDIEETPDVLAGPLAVFVSGKMAVEARINGVAIGANGRPGFSASDETPGRMDSAIFLPAQLLQPGENRVVLFASGHHSLIDLANPVHRISIGAYRDPSRATLSAYQSALVTFGVFALALVFFSVLAVRPERRGLRSLLGALALIAAVQLVTEAGRGLFAYAYPIHDVRLIVIAAGAAALALLTAGWSALRFTPRARRFQQSLIAALVLALAAVLTLAPGFDQKAGYALFLGALASAIPPAWRAFRDRSIKPGLWTLGFLAFALSGLLAPQSFLDRSLFWALSLLFLVNIIDEARRFAAERTARIAEGRRADALASALARAEQAKRPVQIPLISAGRTEYADAAGIARLDAADDYVEVRFKDGRQVLHSGTLAALEEMLPSTFLRVHRSCIVNSDEIAALERDANGSGRLVLKSGGEAPVSRRIMPKVKAALARV